MNIQRLLAATPLFLLSIAPAWAENFTASMYEQGSNKGKLLFTQTQEEIREGGQLKTIRRVFRTPEGKELLVEDAGFENGRLKSVRLNHMQVQEQGQLDVSGGKIQFGFTADGKTKTDSETAPEDLVISATVIPYLQERWDALLKGQSIKMRLAVLDRLETVGFQLTKTGDTTSGGKPAVAVELKPSSFIIAALVKPIRMVFERDSRRLVEYVGRVGPKKQVNGKWEPLDAEGTYTYP